MSRRLLTLLVRFARSSLLLLFDGSHVCNIFEQTNIGIRVRNRSLLPPSWLPVWLAAHAAAEGVLRRAAAEGLADTLQQHAQQPFRIRST